MTKTVGERIRQARTQRGMSGEELARAVGYKGQSAIGNLENRTTGTGGRHIKQIAQALGVPLHWLLAGPDCDAVPFEARPQKYPVTTYSREPTVAAFVAEERRPGDPWPFTTDRSMFDALPASERARIDGYIASVISAWAPLLGKANGTQG